LQGPSHLRRATTEKLRDIFNKYASAKTDKESFMTSEDFVRGYLGLFPGTEYNEVSDRLTAFFSKI
jgi:solute carrier family 25 (mitochondrial aspartate/glutamate transporter), member 12/13